MNHALTYSWEIDISIYIAAKMQHFLFMIERFRERFIRRTPQGRPDVAGTLMNLVGDPRSEHELTPDAYLQTLGEQDRAHVTSFMDFARTLHDVKPGVRVAVTAVGSTVRPESERHHPAEDIDLRVLNSLPAGTAERAEVVAEIQERVKDFLSGNGAEIEDADHTVSTRMVRESRGGLVPFVDWYNNDPSVVARFDEGLPIQVSISGVDNFDLDSYLQKERRHNGHFAVLVEPQQSK